MNNAVNLSAVSISDGHKQHVVCEIQEFQVLPFLFFCASVHSVKSLASLVVSKLSMLP